MKIAIIGETCTDEFIYGKCDKLNPEAPVPVINEISRIFNIGMAGNVQKNLATLGLSSDLITHDEKITKTRFVEKKSNYILLRFDIDVPVTRIDLSSVKLESYDMVIISDYDKGFLTKKDLKEIILRSKITFIDTKKIIKGWIKGVDFIKINEKEYENSCKAGAFTQKLYKNGNIIVTLGEDGAKWNGYNYSQSGTSPVRDVVGAGDTFLAAIAGHYLINKDIEKAIHFANKCAEQVVSKKGVAYPTKSLL